MIVFKIRLCYHFHSVFLFDFLRECFLELTFILRSIFCFLYFDHHVKKGDIYIIPLAVCALILALYCKQCNACVCVCVRAYVRACLCLCVCVFMHDFISLKQSLAAWNLLGRPGQPQGKVQGSSFLHLSSTEIARASHTQLLFVRSIDQIQILLFTQQVLCLLAPALLFETGLSVTDLELTEWIWLADLGAPGSYLSLYLH